MKKGFTVIELAIIAVVVGILLAGIVVGQSLVKTAEVQATITEFAEFRKATANFKDKYRAWPGDMQNASSFWSAGAVSINGDGDGNWGSEGCTLTYDSDEAYEYNLTLVHLSKAGLIEQSFEAVTTANWDTLSANYSEEVYLYGKTGYYAAFPGHYGLCSGEERPLNAYLTNADSSKLSQQIIYDIDRKIDDGIPNSGVFEINKSPDVTVYDVTASDEESWNYYFVGSRDW